MPVFATTRWSVILHAGNEVSAEHASALAQLCQCYWYPIYAFVRRRGFNPHDAQDLTQGFFLNLLERNYLDRADRQLGKFRWFLMGAVKHYLSHEYRKSQAQKRGGGQRCIPLDEIYAEKRFALEPRTDVTPETMFERNWALTVLDRARQQLRDQYAVAGKSDRFEKLEPFLPGGQPTESYAQIGLALGLGEGALRVELHRMKALFRKLVRVEIGHTVSTPTEIDEELQHLITVL